MKKYYLSIIGKNNIEAEIITADAVFFEGGSIIFKNNYELICAYPAARTTISHVEKLETKLDGNTKTNEI